MGDVNSYAGCSVRLNHCFVGSVMRIALELINNQNINIISPNNILDVPLSLIFSWICARSKTGQIKHSKTSGVSAQCFCGQMIREQRALEGMKKQCFWEMFPSLQICFAGVLFWFGLWLMSIDAGTVSGSEPSVSKSWPEIPLLHLDTQRTQSAPCLCFGAVVQNDLECTQGVLMLGLMGESVQRPNKPAWCPATYSAHSGISRDFFPFSLEIIINYKYYYFISKCSLGIATFSTSPLAWYLMSIHIRLENTVKREQKGPHRWKKHQSQSEEYFWTTDSPVLPSS